MAKKDLYSPEAERLFVVEQMSFAEIASRLHLAEKTARNWAAAGGWKEKRQQYLLSRQSFHEELYQFTRSLMESIKNDISAGEKVDTGRLYTFTRLLPLITKIKDYEEAVSITKISDKEKAGLTDDAIKIIQESILNM